MKGNTKPLLVVVLGLPGAGKSFFARRFADTFNAPLVSYDEIRSELFNDLSYSDDENAIVNRIAEMQLRELMKMKKIIVIDGGHNPKVSRNNLKSVAKQAGYEILCIWVQTDERTTRERSLKRSARREDDRFNRSISNDEYDRMARKFTPPSQYERYVVISGRHTYNTQAKTVLKNMIAPQEVKSDPSDEPKPNGRDRRTISL